MNFATKHIAINRPDEIEDRSRTTQATWKMWVHGRVCTYIFVKFYRL